MHLVIINQRLYVPNRLNAIHVALFHGRACRAGIPNWQSADHGLNEEVTSPLLYSCNAYRTPHIATPNLNFVISESVRDSLLGFSGITFAPVATVKVIYLPYAAGDFSFFESPEFRKDPVKFGHQQVFDHWPDRPELHSTIGERYEVVCGNAHRLSQDYSGTVDIQVADPTGMQESVAIPLSPRMIQDHAILGTLQGLLLRGDAFNAIQRNIDPDYFAMAELHL